MKRLVMDLGIDYNLSFVDGRTDINFTPSGQEVLAAAGIVVDAGKDCPPFKMTHAGADMLVVQVFEWNQSDHPLIREAVDIVKRKAILESAKCFGYFGFGTGFLKGKQDLAIIGKGFPMVNYCDGCPVGPECVQLHRHRCDNLGLDSDQVAVDNAIDGGAAAASTRMADRGEATLTWPLKVIQSVLRAN